MTIPSAPMNLVGLRTPMTRVLKWVSTGILVALPVVSVIGFLIDGAAGAWGAALGLAIPAVFFTITVAVALGTARARTEVFGAVVLGSWLVKIVLLIAVMVALRDADFFNKTIFFVCFVIGIVGYLFTEAMIVIRTRVPYVEPGA